MKTKTLHPAGFLLATALVLGGCAGESQSSGQDTGMAADTASSMATAAMPTVIATDLNGPMGVLVDNAGNVWVVDSGVGGDEKMVFPSIADGTPTEMSFGKTSRLIKVATDGSAEEMATFPSVGYPEGPEGANRLAMLNGALYVSSGGWSDGMQVDRIPLMAAVLRFDGGQLTEVANTWDLESSKNPAGALVESHCFGLTAGPDGALWVADAAGNDLLRVDPSTGAVKLVAVFDAMPGPIPNPNRGGAKEIEPVPTAVAFDRQGEMYVSLLSGVPFLPGHSKVVHVSPDGDVTDYSTDLTMLTDLRAGPDGRLYAVSMGVFAEEGPEPNSGALLRIGDGTSEVVVPDLSLPTSVAFDQAGSAYVTINGLGAPGSGSVVKYPGIARPGM